MNQRIVRLYQASTSSASWRARIALALKGIAYESVWIDLYSGGNFAPEYAAVSPTRQVPCLEIDGHRLIQTAAIIEYLEETRPVPALLPADPFQRARVRAFLEIVNAGIQPLHNLAVRNVLAERFGADDPGVRAWCCHWIERGFEALEPMVEAAGGTYALGDAVTAADVFLYPQVHTSRRFDADLARFPSVVAVTRALDGLPPFRDSHPPERPPASA